MFCSFLILYGEASTVCIVLLNYAISAQRLPTKSKVQDDIDEDDYQ